MKKFSKKTKTKPTKKERVLSPAQLRAQKRSKLTEGQEDATSNK